MSTTTKPLSAAQVRKWADAEVKAQQAQAAAKAAAEAAKVLRERYSDRTVPSTDPEHAGKDVRVAEAGGWRIQVARYSDGERFSLRGYKEAGYRITQRMREHISPGAKKTKVTVKRLKGPTRPGSVEPS